MPPTTRKNHQQTKRNNKFLFFIPSPRNIPEVKDQIEKILYGKHDVIWLKFHKEIEAYQKARRYFLTSPKYYDYFVILPDDLVINEKGFDILMQTLLDNPDKLVMSGICNMSCINEEQRNMVPASLENIPILRHSQLRMNSSSLYLTYNDLEKQKDDIIKARFVGFSFCFIHRSVLEKIDFRQEKGLGVDLSLAEDLEDAGISQFLHRKASFLHLKGLSATLLGGSSVNPDVIYTGKYEPYVVFVDSDKKLHS